MNPSSSDNKRQSPPLGGGPHAVGLPGHPRHAAALPRRAPYPCPQLDLCHRLAQHVRRPLSIIRPVIQTMSVEFMPFSLPFFLLLNAFAYRLRKKDVFVAPPNVLGFVLSMALMALYMAYRSKKPPATVSPATAVGLEMKLPEHIKEVQAVPKAVAAVPEGRTNCGAEVHTIDNARAVPGGGGGVKVDDEANHTGGVDIDMAGDNDHAMFRPKQVIKLFHLHMDPTCFFIFLFFFLCHVTQNCLRTIFLRMLYTQFYS
uniref:Bidirectional sugar transporter SWEET n=1 Tax=Oryza meridionalis TaxID=40149 RepID=A0A0E0DNT4_9ORYZ